MCEESAEHGARCSSAGPAIAKRGEASAARRLTASGTQDRDTVYFPERLLVWDCGHVGREGMEQSTETTLLFAVLAASPQQGAVVAS